MAGRVSEVPVVLLSYGHAQAGAPPPPRVIQELLVHTGQPYVVTGSGDGEGEGEDGSVTASTPVPWTIDNKYYTAHVHFRVVPHTEYTPGQAQAVLFLLHKDDAAGLATLQRLAPFDALAVALVIAAADDAATGRSWSDAERSPLEDFCVQHGLEFIDLDDGPDLDSVRSSTAGDRTGDDDDDDRIALGAEQRGVARVAEALSSHMWPHMTMKPRQQRGQDDEDGDTDTDSDGADEDGNRRRDIHHDLGVPSGHAAPTAEDAAAAAPTSTTAESDFGAFVRAEVRAAAGPPPEDQTDAALEGFERLLQAVQGVRARAGDVSDAERRRVAAQMALSLMRQFGLDEDDDDDLDGEEEDAENAEDAEDAEDAILRAVSGSGR